MAADRGYIENLKELRTIRIQQIKQMNADQRYHNLQSEYNRRLLRYNELFVSNMKDMTSKLGSAIAKLSSSLASGVGSAASGVAGGVSSLSGSILSGLGKALPVGIAALLAKVLLWDNMSSSTQGRLSDAFGNLMEKLLGPVKAMIGKITSGFKSLDIKFPLFDELFDRFTKFFEILQSGFKIISLKFDSMMETFGKDPKKYVKDTLNLLGDVAMLGLLSMVAGKVVLQMFKNHYLLSSIDSLLMRRMGGQIPGSGGMLPPVIAPGGRAAPAAPGGTATPRILDQFGRPLPPSTLNATKQATTSILSTVGRAGGRLVGALASGPVLTLLAAGVLAYDAYQILRGWGVSDKDAEEAINMVYPEGFQEVGQLSGKISGTIPLKPLPQDVIADIANPYNVTGVDDLGRTIKSPKLEAQIQREQKILKDYEDNAKAVKEQIRLEEGKDIAPFALRDFYAEWGRMKPNARRIAVEIMQPIIRTLNYVYYMGRDGKPKKMKQDDYLDAILGDNGVEEVSAEDVRRDMDSARRALADLTREGEAGKAGYNAIFKDARLQGMQLPGGKQVSELTMREVMQVQTEMLKRTSTGEGDPHSPIGGYQFVKRTLFGGRVKNKETGKYEDVKGIVKESEMDRVFDPEFQDELFKRMANKNLEAFLSGDITKDQFKTYMMNTWEIFQGKTANAQVFAKRLDAMLDSPEIMQATSSRESGTMTKAQREAEIGMHQRNIDRLMTDIKKPFGNTTPMTVNGVDVVDKVGEEIQDKYKVLKDNVMKSFAKFGGIDPQEISNDLLNTLKIINEVNGVKSGTNTSSAGDTIINNINNVSSTSGGSSGGSVSVVPMRAHHNYEHYTLTGISRYT